MITFIAHLRARPENAAALEAVLAQVRDQSVREPGVAWYSFGESAEEPGCYAVIEVYRDAAAHAAHMAAPWVVASIPRTRALIEGGFDIRQYTTPGTAPAARQTTD